MSLSCEQAEHALRIAKEKAIELNRGPVGIAVVDARGDLICCVRMDGARWYTADVARSKAFASSTWGKTTKDLQASIADNPVVRTVISLGNDFITPAEGAVPIIKDNVILGAIGASGADPEADEIISQAGVDAIVK